MQLEALSVFSVLDPRIKVEKGLYRILRRFSIKCISFYEMRYDDIILLTEEMMKSIAKFSELLVFFN